MATVLTIAGATKVFRAGSLNISKTANDRTTASFEIVSTDGSYRPAMDAEVILTESGTRTLGGLADVVTERGLVNGATDGIVTTVSVVDFNTYAERRYVNETIPAGSLEAALTILTTYLSGYGVTLDAAQVTGPSLPELVYNYRPLVEVLNEIMTLTADAGEPYVWRIDNFKVLKAYQPSTDAAPFDLTGTIPEVIGDMEVETTRGDYANRIILKIPAKTFTNYVQTFTGDGSTYSFELDYSLTAMRYIVTNAGVDELLTFQGIGFDLAVQWLYYSTDNTIRRETTGVPDAPGNLNAISITYDGTREAYAVIAEDAGEIAANGIWERVFVIEDVPSDTTAQALADAELAKRLPVTKTVRYSTLEAGIETGQQQTITVPERNLSGTAVISDVIVTDVGTDMLLRQVTAVVDSAQTNLGRGWRDVYKLWAGDKSGSGGEATSIGAGAPAAVGPAAPNRSVQFNRSGSFGGREGFEFDDNGFNLIVGQDSVITAATAQHCVIFGENSEITDP
jgi:hypothetical protein